MKFFLLCERVPLYACKPNIEKIDRIITAKNKTSPNLIKDLRIEFTIVFKP